MRLPLREPVRLQVLVAPIHAQQLQERVLLHGLHLAEAPLPLVHHVVPHCVQVVAQRRDLVDLQLAADSLLLQRRPHAVDRRELPREQRGAAWTLAAGCGVVVVEDRGGASEVRQVRELDRLPDGRTRGAVGAVRAVRRARFHGFSVEGVGLPVEKAGRGGSDVAAAEVGLREGGDDEGMVVARENVAARNVAANGGLDLLVGEARGQDEEDVGVVGKGFLLFEQKALVVHRGDERIESGVDFVVGKADSFLGEAVGVVLFYVCKRILRIRRL